MSGHRSTKYQSKMVKLAERRAIRAVSQEYRELAELTGQPMAQKINPQIVRKAVR